MIASPLFNQGDTMTVAAYLALGLMIIAIEVWYEINK